MHGVKSTQNAAARNVEKRMVFSKEHIDVSSYITNAKKDSSPPRSSPVEPEKRRGKEKSGREGDKVPAKNDSLSPERSRSPGGSLAKRKVKKKKSPSGSPARIVTAEDKRVLMVHGDIGKVGTAVGTARHTARRLKNGSPHRLCGRGNEKTVINPIAVTN